DCYRSRRTGAIDILCRLIGLKPWRCYTCSFRFYARRVPAVFCHYTHCSRCGNFDLQRIDPDRVPSGILTFIARLLGLPAYRCSPCRAKFFSVLPRRRILPSTMPARDPQSSEP
ncbi:MAG TPA: hypothetical protein VIY66_07970, partial [Candidatus Acidoferrales bacterium]